MGNIKINKMVLDKERFISVLQAKNVKLSDLDKDPSFKYSPRTIARAMQSGLISPTIMNALAKYLNVPTYFLSGVDPLALKIYRFVIYAWPDVQTWNSVIATNEDDAYKIVHEETLKHVEEDDFTIQLRDILPIENGTFI